MRKKSRPDPAPSRLPEVPSVHYEANRARKEWVREAASGFVRMDRDGVLVDDQSRRAQAFRAVDMACLIWDLVEGRFLGKGED